jgi:FMN phosphatase YigB (HAD superfamily)
MKPRGVTFDFWHTLFVPAASLDARITAVALAVGGLGFEQPRELVEAALREGGRLHSEAWRRGEQYGIPFLLRHLDESLGLGLDALQRERLREVIEDPAPGGQRTPMEGAGAVLEELRRRGIRIGIVSDTGWSTGRILRRHLRAARLLDCFEPEALAFSDEVGVPKPNRAIFEVALGALGVEPAAAVHVGDLRFTDIAGARGAGMRSVRFAGAVDDPEPGPEGDAVVASHSELLAAIAAL